MRRLPRHRLHGFTLVELLVAIFIMSLLAVLSWRGIDSMARAQEVSGERADQVATLQTALAQWQTDLDHLQQTQQVSAVDFDGRVLRITRRYGDAELRVVGWTRRGVEGQARWLRWLSPPLRTRGELLTAWEQAAHWAQNPSDAERQRETEVAAIDDWQIFYYRNDSWSNPLSTAAAGAPTVNGGSVLALPPDGVRLVLKLSAGQALAGSLTRDWVRPVIGGRKT